jgi:protein-S-isoprenylcysteine O-methyltransferase Ste14
VKNKRQSQLDTFGKRRIIRDYISRILIAIFLFLSAGTYKWVNGWFYVIIATLMIAATHFLVAINDPELFNERGRQHADTKTWDKTFTLLYMIFFYLALIVAGLDTVRFSWSLLPDWLFYLGITLAVLAGALVVWSMRQNRFFSGVVRIQKDHDHQVVDSGPYKLIRHPGYAGSLLFVVATPLILGSLWSIVPFTIACSMLLIRTALEDKTLREELPGYEKYTQKVRFRIIPRIW